MTTIKKAAKTAKKKVANKTKDATSKKNVNPPTAEKPKVDAVAEKKEAGKRSEVDVKKQEQNRDTKQFNFNGEKLGKGPFVLAAVRFYVKHHPKITLAQMKEAFPDALISRYGVFTDLKTALDKSKTSGKKRYFVNEDQVFEIGGKKYAVTNQITAVIMDKFLDHLKEKGLKVK